MLTKKSELLRLRLEPELYLQVKALAETKKLSVSRFVRDAIEAECIRLTIVNHVTPNSDTLATKSLAFKPKKKAPKVVNPQLINNRNGVQASSLLANLLGGNVKNAR